MHWQRCWYSHNISHNSLIVGVPLFSRIFHLNPAQTIQRFPPYGQSLARTNHTITASISVLPSFNLRILDGMSSGWPHDPYSSLLILWGLLATCSQTEGCVYTITCHDVHVLHCCSISIDLQPASQTDRLVCFRFYVLSQFIEPMRRHYGRKWTVGTTIGSSMECGDLRLRTHPQVKATFSDEAHNLLHRRRCRGNIR